MAADPTHDGPIEGDLNPVIPGPFPDSDEDLFNPHPMTPSPEPVKLGRCDRDPLLPMNAIPIPDQTDAKMWARCSITRCRDLDGGSLVVPYQVALRYQIRDDAIGGVRDASRGGYGFRRVVGHGIIRTPGPLVILCQRILCAETICFEARPAAELPALGVSSPHNSSNYTICVEDRARAQ